MKKLFLLLLIPAFIFSSCTKDDDPAPNDPQGGNAQPYTVTGTVVDTQGQPMAGIKVRADNDAYYGSAEVTTDENGRYTLPQLELGG